jgi:hypothetical protein
LIWLWVKNREKREDEEYGEHGLNGGNGLKKDFAFGN